LAVSWNNLGQALQSSGGENAAAQASDAFDSARQIIEQLVDDYPEELSFRSLCGAVYNNRAMALEAADRLDDALAAYAKAIEQQRTAYDRAPQIPEYREFLSKHYFNYGRALRDAGRPAEAAEISLARRELWPGDGQRLGQVAVELALAAVAARAARDGGNSDAQDRDELADRLEAETAATLRDAAAAGGNLADLQGEKAFQLLRDTAIWTMIKTPAKDDAPLPN
jgi:tetratricopeptide (TPR) repeat protein